MNHFINLREVFRLWIIQTRVLAKQISFMFVYYEINTEKVVSLKKSVTNIRATGEGFLSFRMSHNIPSVYIQPRSQPASLGGALIALGGGQRTRPI